MEFDNLTVIDYFFITAYVYVLPYKASLTSINKILFAEAAFKTGPNGGVD